MAKDPKDRGESPQVVNVRVGSLADMVESPRDVRFTLHGGHLSPRLSHLLKTERMLTLPSRPRSLIEPVSSARLQKFGNIA